MTDESASTRPSSSYTGIFPSGLIFLNSADRLNGKTGRSSYSRPFSASATRTLRTNGEALAPWTIRMVILSSAEIGIERIELARPEPLVVGEPRGRSPHRRGVESALGHASGPRARDQPGALEHA